MGRGARDPVRDAHGVALVGVRVALADRDATRRRSLAAVVGDVAGVTVVGEAGDTRELAKLLRQDHPDVLVVDDRLLSHDGHALAGLGPHRAGMRLIVLGIDPDPAYAARARRLGADAWVVTDRAPEELPRLLGSS
jgi:DNA-binding NarL/FixJ family response regulator